MGPEDLQRVLGFVELREDPGLLVGLESPDDAAVYRLGANQAIVASVDFFTPIVDDPEDFGAIAAANALSDLYAMRARPLFALNVLAVRLEQMGAEVVGAILQGATETCAEAGISVAGGHSIDDPEPKFGMVVLGLADPELLWRKAGARPGDAILLGKALGTGVVSTGLKQGVASAESAGAAVRSMRQPATSCTKTSCTSSSTSTSVRIHHPPGPPRPRPCMLPSPRTMPACAVPWAPLGLWLSGRSHPR